VQTLDLTDALVNKPFTATIGGRKREIGRIRSAEYDRGDITVTLEVTDEDLAGQLNRKALSDA
jgi:hypothetical protein